MELQSMYQAIILDHNRNPHHAGLRDDFGAEVHHINPTCGDEVTLRVHLDDESRGDEAVIQDVSYESRGCSISKASASVMSDLVIGKNVGEAFELHQAFLELMQSKGQDEGDEDVLEDAVAFAGVSKFPARVKCALLSWMAMKDAAVQALAGGGGDGEAGAGVGGGAGNGAGAGVGAGTAHEPGTAAVTKNSAEDDFAAATKEIEK